MSTADNVKKNADKIRAEKNLKRLKKDKTRLVEDLKKVKHNDLKETAIKIVKKEVVKDIKKVEKELEFINSADNNLVEFTPAKYSATKIALSIVIILVLLIGFGVIS